MRSLLATLICTTAAMAAIPAGAIELVYATQTGRNVADYRRDIPVYLAEELKSAGTDITLKVNYDGELVTAGELWRAVTGGAADIVNAFLPTTAGSPPEALFSGLPALALKPEDVDRLNASAAMRMLGEALKAKGGVLLGGYWDSVAVGSTGACIGVPSDVASLAIRGPGRAYDVLFAGEGAITVATPSTEIARALRTGAIDIVMSTPSAITAGGGHKHLKCLSDPTVATPGMVFVATVMAAQRFDSLPPAVQQGVLDAGRKASARVQADAFKATAATIEGIRKDGVTVQAMGAEEIAAWRKAAEKLSWPVFARVGPKAAEMLAAAAAATKAE